MPNLTDVLNDEDRPTVEQIVVDMGYTGDMQKSVYDSDDSGVVDNAELVGGLAVLTAVPATVKFTNITYKDENNIFTVAQTGDKNTFEPVTGTLDIDFATSNRFESTIIANTTINLPSNLVANQGGVIYIIQGGSGSYTLTWNAVFKPMNTDTSTGDVGDVQVYSYEVYSATKIILNYVGTI